MREIRTLGGPSEKRWRIVARVGISNRKTRRRSISVILIRKYNDRRSRLAAGAGRDRANKRKRKVEGEGEEGSDGVACERRLSRICYGPIAIVTPIYEFHCDTAAHPFGWLRCLVGLQCIRECVYNVYLFTVYFV